MIKCEECGIEVVVLQSRFDRAEGVVNPQKVCVRRLCSVCVDVWDAVSIPYFLTAQVDYIRENEALMVRKRNLLNPSR